MKDNEINVLAEKGNFEGQPFEMMTETHISWVLFTNDHVFKIKKPIKLSFLDYSTIELRKKYCEKEIQLNSRYTDIYLEVLPISQYDNSWSIGENKGEIRDHAVLMKRMDSDKEMDKMLEKDLVNKKLVSALAEPVADFHQNAEKVFATFDLGKAKNTFNDIQGIRDISERKLADRFTKLIDESIHWSNQFLDQHAKRLQERIDLGFKRDAHGDLHSGNIFLYDKPVLFDCIEFNDDFRQIDLLYEVAFMCMDLEAFDKKVLAGHFLSSYLQKLPCIEQKEDENIFVYFKCLRANIRAKVHGINARQTKDPEEKKYHIGEMVKYFGLMESYMNDIS